jgi:hypothetical protein
MPSHDHHTVWAVWTTLDRATALEFPSACWRSRYPVALGLTVPDISRAVATGAPATELAAFELRRRTMLVPVKPQSSWKCSNASSASASGRRDASSTCFSKSKCCLSSIAEGADMAYARVLDDRFHESCHNGGIHPGFRLLYRRGAPKMERSSLATRSRASRRLRRPPRICRPSPASMRPSHGSMNTSATAPSACWAASTSSPARSMPWSRIAVAAANSSNSSSFSTPPIAFAFR